MFPVQKGDPGPSCSSLGGDDTGQLTSRPVLLDRAGLAREMNDPLRKSPAIGCLRIACTTGGPLGSSPDMTTVNGWTPW